MPDAADPLANYQRKQEMFNAYLATKLPGLADAEAAGFRGANEFAQQGFKSLVLLNGGAVLLAPTAQKLFSGPTTLTGDQLIRGVATFCVGLFCVLLAYALAFYQQQFYVFRMAAERQHLTSHAMLTYFPPTDAAAKDNAQTDLANEWQTVLKNHKRSLYLQIGAAFMAFVSLAAFGGGSLWLVHAAMN